MSGNTAMLVAGLLAGCGAGQASGTAASATGEAGDSTVVQLEEAFLTPATPADNVDSPAVWHGPNGETWLLATAKEGDRVLVYDARTGEPIDSFGAWGSGPGQLERPNGIVTMGDYAMIVERDNRRVQIFRLPEFEPAGSFGEEQLRNPYGIAAFSAASGDWEVYITDAYETPNEQIPPDSELGERVKHFRVRVEDGMVSADFVRAFGATSGPGVLHQVESIHADTVYDHLLIADEEAVDIKVYSLDGTYTGTTFGGGLFRSEPEGIALYACGDEGYWIITDQSDLATDNTFHIFDRVSLEHRGAFRGRTIANTDGVALTQRPVGEMEAGVFYAAHLDQGVGAIAWAGIAEALALRSDCVR